MDIVCFGQQNWDFCWTAKQHLMTRLARRGHRILYVDRRAPPQRLPTGRIFKTIVDGGFPGVRKISVGAAGSLAILTPQTFAALGWRRSEGIRHLHLRLALRHLGIVPEVVLVLHPWAEPFAARLAPLGLVYYAVDEYTAYGTNVSDAGSETRVMENRLLARAQICLAVSPPLRERFARHHARAFLLQNGADVDHFAPEQVQRCRPHADLAGLPGPLLGFIGQVDERLDQELLLELARRQPGWQFVLAGRIKEGLDLARLDGLANVHFLGYQPHESLPRVARAVDLWLVPYRKTDLTHACNPMKVFEYLATGKPVVAVPLQGLVEGREAVHLAEGVDAFERAIQEELTKPETGRTERLATAARLDWEKRTDCLENYLLQAVELGAGERGIVPARARMVAAGKAHRHLPFPAGVNEHGRLITDAAPGLAHRALLRMTRLAGALFYTSRIIARICRREPPLQVQRILIARRTRLGDLVCLLPTLAALRTAWPKAKLTLAMQPGVDFHPLLDRYVDEVLPLDFLWAPSKLRRLLALSGFFRRGFDLVFTGSRTFFLPETLFSGAPKLLGIYNGDIWQEQAGWVIPRDLHRHEADNNLQLVEAFFGPVAPETRIPTLKLDPWRMAQSGKNIDTLLNVSVGAPLLLVHSGANRNSRRWPIDRIVRTLECLLRERPDLHIVLTGTVGEKEIVRSIIELLPLPQRSRVRDLAGRTGLPELIALLRRVSVVLCNDTGIMHLARALDIPLAATCGPENHRLWGPYPCGRAPAIVLRREVPCAPCGRDLCPQLFCMRALPVDAVLAALRQLLDDRRPFPQKPERTLVHDATRLSWRRLRETGFSLPRVSVLLWGKPGELLDAAVDRMLDALEPQSYPEIELLIAGELNVQWQDRRDAAARQLLPVRRLAAATGVWQEDLRDVLEEIDSELLTCFFPDRQEVWWRERLGADVAAWMREPTAAAYADGIPLRTVDSGMEMLHFTIATARLRQILPPREDKAFDPRPVSSSAGGD